MIDTVKEEKMVRKMVDGKETEVEKEWSYFRLSPYKFMSFIEFQRHVNTLGARLKKIGLAKSEKVRLNGATRYAYIIDTARWAKC